MTTAYVRPSSKLCVIQDCEGEVRYRQGWCHKHYCRWRRYGNPLGGGSDKPHVGRGRQLPICKVDGCERQTQAKGYCPLHYRRFRDTGDPGPLGLKVAPKGSGWINKDGYRLVTVDGRGCFEHRLVMEVYIGRPLTPDETVHHRNGVRHDNRLENLELRVASHGPHITVRDALVWAREILDRYALFDGQAEG